jgi:hypothetical protein
MRVVEAFIGRPSGVERMIMTLGSQHRDGIVARLDLRSDPPMILISYLSRRRPRSGWGTFTA